MKGTAFAVALVALAAAGLLLPGDAAEAKNKRSDFRFGGKWQVTLDTPLGEIPVVVGLQPNGKGKLWIQGEGHVPVVHQYEGNWISWTIELPAVQAPDDNGHTIIGRGVIGEDGSLSGDVIIVTTIADQESPVGYETHVGKFSATRSGK